MFCGNCGTKNDDKDAFCANCGQRLEDDNATRIVYEPQYQMNQYEQKSRASNTPLVILLSVSALILVTMIALGAFMLLKMDKGPEEVSQATTEQQSEEAKPTEKVEPTIAPTASVAPTAPPPVETTVAEEPSPVEEPAVVSETTVTHNEFVFPDSDVRLITSAELDMLDKDQIRIARNELFARRGRIFESADMKEYFNNQAWYSGTVPATIFDGSRGSYMNKVELENMNFIVEYEKKHGINP